MNKAQLETKLRNEFLSLISNFISENRETDVLPVSANELAIPCLDEEGNEKSLSLLVLVMAKVDTILMMVILSQKITSLTLLIRQKRNV